MSKKCVEISQGRRSRSLKKYKKRKNKPYIRGNKKWKHLYLIVWYKLHNSKPRKIYGLKGEAEQNTATKRKLQHFCSYPIFLGIYILYEEFSILVLSVSLVLLHASQNSIMSMTTLGNKNMSIYRQKIET